MSNPGGIMKVIPQGHFIANVAKREKVKAKSLKTA
jgi:hypothetical protein